MAFSSEDKHRIIFSLCYAGSVIDPNSVLYNSIVSDRLNNLSLYTEEQALKLVDKIDSLKTAIEGGYKKDNVTRIGDIELEAGKSTDLMRKELRRLLMELSKLLDLPSQCNYGNVNGCVWV
jgi:hypothetical protein